ncbi:FYVE, RhoGEF and PH domain-containing protein 2 [Lamellibrachia satsuma]|nr:FYVE, RhoGEF and PH domain-containing protein 2 [Lamellibrachia satsuma]
MTTERDYVRKLEILVTAKNKTVRILQPDVAKAMFKDVEVIYQFHHDTLLPELQNRLTAWDKDDRIGDIMKKLAPFLKLSTEYVKQFESALTLVETWQKKSSSFAALLREIAENPDYGRLHLNAHMMEPVQRIPRYGLLLRGMSAINVTI